jgi:hypothetical protein
VTDPRALRCPCVRGERPVAPCTPDTCYHFSVRAGRCANCGAATLRGRKKASAARRLELSVGSDKKEMALYAAAAERAGVPVATWARRVLLAAAEEAAPK